MKNHEEPASALSDYLGFDRRKLAIFSGLVAAVVVVVTGIYVSIFGFDSWKSNMSQASSMMLSNFDVPNAAASATTGPVGPAQAAFAPATGQAGAQYVCPSCGAVGLPRWSTGGSPLCPNCGSMMGVAAGAGGQARLAAQP